LLEPRLLLLLRVPLLLRRLLLLPTAIVHVATLLGVHVPPLLGVPLRRVLLNKAWLLLVSWRRRALCWGLLGGGSCGGVADKPWLLAVVEPWLTGLSVEPWLCWLERWLGCGLVDKPWLCCWGWTGGLCCRPRAPTWLLWRWG
jgi:hypothetical protein